MASGRIFCHGSDAFFAPRLTALSYAPAGPGLGAASIEPPLSGIAARPPTLSGEAAAERRREKRATASRPGSGMVHAMSEGERRIAKARTRGPMVGGMRLTSQSEDRWYSKSRRRRTFS